MKTPTVHFSPISSYLLPLRPRYLLSTLFSNTLSLCSSEGGRQSFWYGSFITMFISARHRSLYRARWIHSTQSHALI